METDFYEIPVREYLKKRLVEFIKEDNEAILRDSENESLVIFFDSSWGTGKTTFVKSWMESQEDFKTIYYNAWENDDYPNAFQPLMSKIIECSLKDNKNMQKLGIEIDIRLSSIVKGLGKTLINKTISKVDEDLAKDIIDVLESIQENNFKEWFPALTYEEFRKLVCDFEFSKLMSLMSEEKYIEFRMNLAHKKVYFTEYGHHLQIKKEFQKKLQMLSSEDETKTVIVLDELDRCRPDFAIQTLEFIKHYFNNKNFVFLICTDLIHLGKSISSIYGGNIDADEYLTRFYDVKLSLPMFSQNKSDYILDKLKKYELNTRISKKHMVQVVENFNLSLRDINTTIRSLKIIMDSQEGGIIQAKNDELTVYYYLIVLKIKYPSVYNLMLFGKFNFDKGTDSGYEKIDTLFLMKELDVVNKAVIALANTGNNKRVDESSESFILHSDIVISTNYHSMRLGDYIDYILSFV